MKFTRVKVSLVSKNPNAFHYIEFPRATKNPIGIQVVRVSANFWGYVRLYHGEYSIPLYLLISGYTTLYDFQNCRLYELPKVGQQRVISYYSTNSEYEPGGQGVEPARHLVRRWFMWIIVHKLGPFQAKTMKIHYIVNYICHTKHSDLSCLYYTKGSFTLRVARPPRPTASRTRNYLYPWYSLHESTIFGLRSQN